MFIYSHKGSRFNICNYLRKIRHMFTSINHRAVYAHPFRKQHSISLNINITSM